jgi:hypothetical protein
MILTEDVGKDKLLKRIKENEQELGGNIEELEKRGDVTIESTSGWYFPDGASPNPYLIIPTFTAMVDLAINNRKKSHKNIWRYVCFF